MKKIVFDTIFIISAAIILIIMTKILSSNDYIAFSFLPVLIAYYIGQFSQQKYDWNKKKKSNR